MSLAQEVEEHAWGNTSDVDCSHLCYLLVLAHQVEEVVDEHHWDQKRSEHYYCADADPVQVCATQLVLLGSIRLRHNICEAISEAEPQRQVHDT
jgi:hypothetical protein